MVVEVALVVEVSLQATPTLLEEPVATLALM
jgi:hypothetical protein